MSFVPRDDVIAVAEDIVTRLWSELAGYLVPTPLPRMTYADAMARYGSDKPDLRFGSELTDLTEYFSGTGSRVLQAQYAGAVVMPGGGSPSVNPPFTARAPGWADRFAAEPGGALADA